MNIVDDINGSRRETIAKRIREGFTGLEKADTKNKYGKGKRTESVTVTRGGKTFQRKQHVGTDEEDTEKRKKKPIDRSGDEHTEKLMHYAEHGKNPELKKKVMAELKKRGKEPKAGSPKWYGDMASKYKLTALPSDKVSRDSVEIDISGDTDSHWIMRWRDPKTGKVVRSYSQGFHERTAAVKWGRMMSLSDGFLSSVDSKAKALIGSEDKKLSECGVIIAIIAKTGLRVGSKESLGDTGNQGVSTLTKSSVSVDGDTISFDFIGKSHKRNKATITDSRLASAMSELMEDKNPDDAIFSVDRGKVMSVFRNELGYTKYKIKDMRTMTAGNLAIQALYGQEPPPPLPESDKEAAKLISSRLKMCFDFVSSRLNNTPAMAKKSYVHPAILQNWLTKIGAAGMMFKAVTKAGLPTIKEIGNTTGWPALDEGLNEDDYLLNEDEDDESYDAPEWMVNLMEGEYEDDGSQEEAS